MNGISYCLLMNMSTLQIMLCHKNECSNGISNLTCFVHSAIPSEEPDIISTCL